MDYQESNKEDINLSKLIDEYNEQSKDSKGKDYGMRPCVDPDFVFEDDSKCCLCC